MKNTAFSPTFPTLVALTIAFLCFFAIGAGLAQPKPAVVMSEEDKAISKIIENEAAARVAAAAAEAEHQKCPYDCRIITDAIATVEKGLEIIQKELQNLKKLKENLEKEIKTLDDKKNKTKAETDKLADLKKRRDDVDQKIKTAEILEQNAQSHLTNTRNLAHGLVTGAEIGGIAEGMRTDRIGIDAPADESKADRKKREKAEDDLNDNAQKIIDEIAKEAKTAAAKDPCDAESVRDAVNKKLAELYKKYVDDERDPVQKTQMKAWFERHFYIATKKGKAQPHIEQEGGGEPNGKPTHRDGLSYISIRPEECPPPAMFTISITGGADFSPNLPPGLFQAGDWMQLASSVYEQPELMEAFFSTHGGEWAFGEPSKGRFFIRPRSSAERQMGGQASLRIGRHGGLQAGVNWGQTTAEADFQVQSLSNTTVSTGTAQTTLRHLHAQVCLRYYSCVRNPVQLFAGLGVQFSRQKAGSLTAQWGPALWTVRDVPAEVVWAGTAQAGLLFNPRKSPLSIELTGGGSLPASEGYGKTPAPFARVALGLRF